MPLSKAKDAERKRLARVQPNVQPNPSIEEVITSTEVVRSTPIDVNPIPAYPTPLTSAQFALALYPKILAKGERCTLEHCIICNREMKGNFDIDVTFTV